MMSTPGSTYLAVIGDIVGSREQSADDRAETQQRLEASLKALNRSRKRLGIASDFTITLGDEFQVLLHSAAHVWHCLFRIERDLYPSDLRFALGVGEIVTSIKQRTALGMDGPAFHHARAGIETLRRAELRYGVYGLDPEPPYLADALELISRQRNTWKLARVETFVDLLEGQPPAATADRLELSVQAIYKNLSDGALHPISRILAACSNQIGQALGAE